MSVDEPKQPGGLSRTASFATKQSGSTKDEAEESLVEALDKLDDPLMLTDEKKSADSDKDAVKLKPVPVLKLFR
ncbi:hypothetical protein GGI13_000678, partial [Coemansia sp. RSA 455]